LDKPGFEVLLSLYENISFILTGSMGYQNNPTQEPVFNVAIAATKDQETTIIYLLALYRAPTGFEESNSLLKYFFIFMGSTSCQERLASSTTNTITL
jgi:hypothetical protein